MLRYAIVGSAVFAMMTPTLAHADRDDRVSPRERASVLAAIKRIGCTSPRQIERDDGGYEVDNARCRGGVYDVKLSRGFKVLHREREDRRDGDDRHDDDRHDD